MFPDGHVVSGGAYGQPLSVAADYLGAALCSLANISEADSQAQGGRTVCRCSPRRRIELRTHARSIPAAALASESKVLAHPAKVDTVPTSADQKTMSVCRPSLLVRQGDSVNVANVLAIEYFAASQAGLAGGYVAYRRVALPQWACSGPR